jgi:hypothetical protein
MEGRDFICCEVRGEMEEIICVFETDKVICELRVASCELRVASC